MNEVNEMFAPLLIGIEQELPFNDILKIYHQAKCEGLFAVETIELLSEHKKDLFITNGQIELITRLIECLNGRCESQFDLSDKKEDVITHIALITDKYKYHKLPKKLSERSIKLYKATLPDWCKEDGDVISLITSNGMTIAKGYKRIVIGDYGAFVEFDRTQAIRGNICVKRGQEYRYKDPNFSDQVKFYWYTTKCGSDIKIYFQQKEVTYADYKPLMLYASPFECAPDHQ